MAETRTREPMTAEGKTLFQIDVTQTRYGTLFVLADDEASAKDDAEEMSCEVQEHEWDNIETDWTVRVAWDTPGPHDDVWTGGPEGRNAKWPALLAAEQGRETVTTEEGGAQ